MWSRSWTHGITARLQRLIVKDLRLSQYSFFSALEPLLADDPIWLDAGCGRELLPAWFRADYKATFRAAIERVSTIIGADYDEASLRDSPLTHKVRSDLRILPFPDRAFDLVTANMVVEHLDCPEACLREIKRVLKPSGVFIFHTPNLSSPLIALASVLPGWVRKSLARVLEERSEENVFPTRYWLKTAQQFGSLRRNAASKSGRSKPYARGS